MSNSLNWGLLATGRIAATFAHAVKLTTNGTLYAVGSRSQESADRFAAEHGVPKAYGSYEALLADPAVDAVYISTPHPMHMEWVIKAAKAGKHILCEKPIAMNLRETQAMIDAARENNVALMEAFMYRCHPMTHKVLEIVRSGTLGEIRMIQASYGFSSKFDPASRLFDKALGGSGLMDVGLYPVSYSRLIAGAANGQDFADPLDIHAVAHLGETGVDEWSAAVLRFPGEIIAQLATSLRVHLENNLRIIGSGGQLSVNYPFHPSWFGPRKITVTRGPFCPVQEITVKEDRPLFTIATETFARHVLQGDKQVAAPGMRWDDTLGNMRTLDRWRKCIGLSYDCDKA